MIMFHKVTKIARIEYPKSQKLKHNEYRAIDSLFYEWISIPGKQFYSIALNKIIRSNLFPACLLKLDERKTFSNFHWKSLWSVAGDRSKIQASET